jgi:two-component SAPR family response regulator
MGLILWIDHNTFATSLLEKVFKKQSLPFYTVHQVDDFAFLVEDLKPVLIVLNSEIFLQNAESFLKQYQASASIQDTPFVLVGAHESLSFIKNKIGELHKPLEPFDIPDQLRKFLTAN